MNEQKIRNAITQSIQDLARGNAGEKLEALFQTLGYSTERKFELDSNEPEDFIDTFGFEEINHKRAKFSEWSSVDFLFQLTEDEIFANPHIKLFNNQIDLSYLKSYIFLCISLHNNYYTRTQLSDITREINRQSDIPIMILFRHGDSFTLSVINRRPNKREISKDVLEKITLIKDIKTDNPHRAHIEILFDLSLEQLYKKHKFTNFDQLHNAWQDTLDISELNNKFFKELAYWYFWAVEHVKFPDGAEKDETVRNAVSVIRLLTRLIFVWFLMEKGLIEGSLFNDNSLCNVLKSLEPSESTFYRAILQNLFFATLNQEMGQRETNNLYCYKDYFLRSQAVLKLFQEIPFLNGGLFECLDKRIEEQGRIIDIRIDGFCDNPEYAAVVPNFLFFSEEIDADLNHAFGTKNKRYPVRGLIHILNRYKFTIAENTPIEQEIALDPELLGKVFENLLGSYNEETKTTARKKTGSFYTPREIVDYMVDESLIAYLETKLTIKKDSQERQQNLKQRLRYLFSYTVSDTEKLHQFTEDEVLKLIEAIDSVNILDPACGSGAFPLGVLHKLVFILKKLDPNNKRWKQQQKEREIQSLLEDIQTVQKISYEAAREIALEQLQERLHQIEEDFDRNKNEIDYPRKLFLIENCIYGIDIQPIAVQITKLRFFISLIVDQKTDNNQPNRGILPLPNLETKFVAADALLPIKLALRSQEIIHKEAELAKVRKKHFTARTQKNKQKYRERDEELRQEICELLINIGLQDVTTESLAQWNPYEQNTSAKFFDPKWMFALSDGFDIVLGNPPYVRQQKIKELKAKLKPHYDCYTGNADLYVYFYERGFQLLREGGTLAYITSNKWFRADYGVPLRKYIAQNSKIYTITDFGELSVFDAATFPMIFIARKLKVNQQSPIFTQVTSLDPPYPDVQALIAKYGKHLPSSAIKGSEWILTDSSSANILKKMEQIGVPLREYVNDQIYRGVLTGFNKAFVIDRTKRSELIAEDPKSAEIIKPLAIGDDVRKWHIRENDQWLLFIPWHFPLHEDISIAGASEKAEKEFEKRYPAVYKHLLGFKKELSTRNKAETGIRYEWYALQRCAATYWQMLDKPKILYPEIAKEPRFCFDTNGIFINNKVFLIPVSDLYLLGVLNSAIVWNYLKGICSVLGDPDKGGRLELRSIYIDKIPIPHAKANKKSVIETLVNYIIYLTAELKDIPIHGEKMVEAAEDKLMLSYFEQIINGLVYELYLPEELHEHNLTFAIHLQTENSPHLDNLKGDKLQALREIFQRLYATDHPIRQNLFALDTLPIIRMIEGRA